MAYHAGGSLGYVQFDLNVSLIVISSIIMAMRLHVRGVMTGTPGPDDYLAIVAFVSRVTQTQPPTLLAESCSRASLSLSRLWRFGRASTALGATWIDSPRHRFSPSCLYVTTTKSDIQLGLVLSFATSLMPSLVVAARPAVGVLLGCRDCSIIHSRLPPSPEQRP